MPAACLPQRLPQEYDETWVKSSSGWLHSGLLRHIEEHQAHVVVGNSGTHAHVTENGGHHSWGELLWSGVTTATVGAVTLLALDAHGVGVVAVSDQGRACFFLARRPFGTGSRGPDRRTESQRNQ